MKNTEIIEYIPDAFKIAIGDEVCFRPKYQRAWFNYSCCRTGAEWHKSTNEWGSHDIEARTGIVSAIINTEHGKDVILNYVWSNKAQKYVTVRMSYNRVWPTKKTIQDMQNRACGNIVLYTRDEMPDNADAAIPIKLTRRNQFIFTVWDNDTCVIADYAKTEDGQIYKIVRIDNNAFRTYDFGYGIGIYIPNTVSEIGAYAFAETTLYGICGGQNIRKIEHNAFTHTDIVLKTHRNFCWTPTKEIMKNHANIDVDKIEIGRMAFDR